MAKILLIEDNEMNRDMLVRRLVRVGYEVPVAENGREGLEKAIAEKPDLILMDLCLPEIDGFEATKQLKADKKTRGIPLIVLTARFLKRDKKEAISAGCDDFDVKPINFTRLLEKIERFLMIITIYFLPMSSVISA